MGCCFSTTTKSTTSTTSATTPRKDHHESESIVVSPLPAPPLPLEEETVKEVVLHETPIHNIPSLLGNDGTNKADHHHHHHHHHSVAENVKSEPTAVILRHGEIVSDSEVSERQSFSQSISAVTETKGGDGDGEVTQSRVKGSPGRIPGKRINPSNQTGGKDVGRLRSPARTVEQTPAPVRRNRLASRSVQSRTVTTRQPMDPPKRDSGETAGQRTRTSIARGDAAPRRPASLRPSKSTSAVRTGGRKIEVTVGKRGYEQKLNDGAPPAATESEENPLVSLECFIFL